MDSIKFLTYSVGVSILIGGLGIGYYFSIVLPENQRINNELKQKEVSLKEAQFEKENLQKEIARKEADEKKKIEEIKENKKEEEFKKQELEKNIKNCTKMGVELLEIKKVKFASENSQNSHYNKSLGGCYVLIISTIMNPDQESGIITEVLFNADEQKQVGLLIFNFSPFELKSCYITTNKGITQKCEDQVSFNKLANVYLKN